jgi:hypothetical protein
MQQSVEIGDMAFRRNLFGRAEGGLLVIVRLQSECRGATTDC